jgi:2-keto-4-pentenoate hydratase/2-oxohepta-3-ene-1,7-dioic acid hydratase in catechol pathway
MKVVRFIPPGGDPALAHSGELQGDAVRKGRQRYPLEKVRLLAPVIPRQIICVGVNYRAHAEERGHKLPERPLLFFKPPSAVIGPDEAIRLPDSPRVDYEAEVAVVIGQRAQRVKAKDAEAYIWGYTGFNDVSDRVTQQWESHWVRAKGFDTAAPLGPWIATPDEIEKPIEFQLRLNGEIRQQSHTGELIFPIPELIEEITSRITLERGDLIATGTPAGVGPLQPGDTVEVELAGVGCLRNTVEQAP